MEQQKGSSFEKTIGFSVAKLPAHQRTYMLAAARQFIYTRIIMYILFYFLLQFIFENDVRVVLGIFQEIFSFFVPCGRCETVKQ